MSARPQVSWLNVAFGLVLAGAVVSVLWWLSTQAMTSNTVPLKAASDSQQGGALAARMWVDSARLYPGQTLRVHAIFENRSRYPIGGFRFLDFRHDGLLETGPDWDRHRPSCVTPAGAALSLPGAIQPGEAVRCEAELQADRERPTGQLGILVVYLWSQIEDNPDTQAKPAQRSVTRTGSLQLAPLAATTPLRERLSVALRLSPNLLPILLVVLGWLIDRERQRREHSGQLDRARSDTVWTQQVARLLKYTQIYYLPIARNILALSTYHAQMSALGTPAAGSQGAVRRDALRRRMFFHFLMFWVSVRSLREGLGGWFLSDAKAEAILQRGWQSCLYLCAMHLKDEQLDAAADVFDKPIGFTKFLVQLRIQAPSGQSPLQAVEAQFYDWVDQTPAAPATANSFVQTLSLLEAMRWVLRFEWDSPFTKGGYWYEEKKEIEPDDLRNAAAGIPDAAARGIQPGHKDDLALLLKEYQETIDSYFKPPEGRPRRFLRKVWHWR